MQFNIPFLNTKLSIGLTPEGQARGRSQGVTIPYGNAIIDNTGTKISLESFFRLWRSNVDISACVREISETSCSGGVTYKNPRTGDPVTDQIKDKFLSIFAYQDQFGIQGWKQRVLESLLICGNVFIEKVRNKAGTEVLGLKVLDPRTISIVTDVYGRVYRYIQGANAEFNWVGEPIIFEPKDLIHWKLGTDPNSEAFGMSPMEPVMWDAKADVEAAVTNYKFFQNQSIPYTQLILDESVDPEEAAELVTEMRKQFGGSKNAGKMGVLRKVKDIKQLSLSAKDMDYINGRNFITEKVCSVYGVPKAMLGYTTGMTFNNVEGQMKRFYDSTVRKYELMLTHIINDEIIKDCLQMQDVLVVEIKEARLDSEQMMWDRVRSARESGLITVNEARDHVDLPPLDPALHADFGDRIISGSGTGMRQLIDAGIDPNSSPSDLVQLQEAVKSLDRHVHERE